MVLFFFPQLLVLKVRIVLRTYCNKKLQICKMNAKNITKYHKMLWRAVLRRSRAVLRRSRKAEKSYPFSGPCRIFFSTAEKWAKIDAFQARAHLSSVNRTVRKILGVLRWDAILQARDLYCVSSGTLFLFLWEQFSLWKCSELAHWNDSREKEACVICLAGNHIRWDVPDVCLNT